MRLVLFLSLFLAPAVALAAPLSASRSDTSVGFAVAGVDQSASILGFDSSTQGAMVGLQATAQRGAGFRGELRLLRGSLDYETGGVEASGNATLFGVRSTWGAETDAGDRIYGGIGLERMAADSPFGPGDGTTWSAYVPIGITRYADWYDHWRVAVSLEGQLLLASRAEIDNIPGVGDESFTSIGGAGLRVSADFEANDAPLRISPYLHVSATADSETKDLHGVSVQIEDQRSEELGVRALLRF